MHELTFVQSIVQQVRALKTKHGFSRVREIEIISGPYHSINEDNLEFLLQLVDDTCLQDTRVRLVRFAKKHYCTSCAMEFENDDLTGDQCPGCLSRDSVCGAPSPLFINKLEVDE